MSHHIYKREGSENWWIDVRVKGRQRIRRSAGTPDKEKAKALAIANEAREWERLTKGDPATTTFAEAALMYMSEGHNDPWGYVPKLVRHFKNKKLAEIKPGHIKAAAREIYPNAKTATWNRQVLTPAQAIINYAATKEICHPIRVQRFRVAQQLQSSASDEWFEKFSKSAPDRLRALSTLTRTTGARIAQAISLEWRAINLQAGTALIPAAKGHPERTALLTQALVVMLANLPEPHQGRVFGYQHRWSVYKPWRRACEAAGIPYIPTHSVGRRGFATAMQRAGVDPKTAAQRGGWKSVKLMLDIYADADSDPALIERVFGTFESQSPKSKQRNRL